MLILEDICGWWWRKLDNYLKKYAIRNWLTLAQAKAQFFTEMHEKILEVIIEETKKHNDHATHE
jgi:hypothetical protein